MDNAPAPPNDAAPFTEAALAALTEDNQPNPPAAAVRGLQRLLATLDGLARTELVARWASSNGSLRRTAIAHALNSDLRVLGSTTALDCLASDVAPTVRAAAYATVASRIAAGGDELSDMLWRGAGDRDADARASAIVGVKRVAQHGNESVRAEARRLLGAR